MCGLVGVVGPGPQVVPLKACSILSHRGPDDEAMAAGDGFALGFRRLAILDLSPAGRQPMRSEDGACYLVFNGEIYNYLELRDGLEARGERFRSRSDTEVLLTLLRLEGSRALDRLNGMFAFCFVDLRTRRFLIARDRLGVKPLYLRRLPQSVRFASELKALLTWPDADAVLDGGALATYFALGYLPSSVCIFRGYEKLAPAHLIEGSLDDPASAQPRRWWSVTITDGDAEHGVELGADRMDELDALLADATRIRLRSDVKVGVFLSGGIDSGLVASYSSRGGGSRPYALTIGWSEADFDETALAAETAGHSGLSHITIPQSIGNLGAVDRLAWFYDEPFADVSALPTFALCEVARREGIVFLGGDGGDEAFGGYHRHVEAEAWRWLKLVPEVARTMARKTSALLPAFSQARYRILKAALRDDGFAAAFDSVPEDPAVEALLHDDLRPSARAAAAAFWDGWVSTRGRSVLARQQQLDYDLYLPDDILVKVDRASMAHSIELRSPFLDYRVVEWAARLPRRSLLHGGVGKLPLRALAKRHLPNRVAQGEKRGFGVPLDSWIGDARVLCLLKERLLSSEALAHRLWSERGVRLFLGRLERGGGRSLSNTAWKLLFLDAWAKHYLDGRSPPASAPAA